MSIAITTIRLACAALLASCAGMACAQTVSSTSARFVPVDSVPRPAMPAATTADPTLYLDGPGGPAGQNAYTSDPNSPYAGTVVNLFGMGPQAKITGVTLFAYSHQVAAYQRIQARIKFWSAYRPEGDPVFGAASSTFVIDMADCPCNFEANKAYSVNITLPKPVYTEGMNGIGFSLQWLVDYGDGLFVHSAEFLPALDISGNPPQVGGNIADYGNAGRSPDDMNFAPADNLATQRNLAVGLQGEATFRLTQCSGATGYRNHFVEEFDDSTAFAQRWDAYPNGGSYSEGSGRIQVFVENTATQFPYVRSKIAMIPASGDFSVRWLARYDSVGPNGDGELVVSRGKPLNGDDAPATDSAMRAWQDQGGFFGRVRTASGADQSVGLGNGTTLHDLEYCWIGNNVELWQDGTLKFQATRDASAPRPDALWFGNPVDNVGNLSWNNFTLYRVQVRKPGNTCYVNASAGSGTHDGNSWNTAYTDLQSALYGSCTEIWVAKGTYKPTTDDNRHVSFDIPSGVGVYGGFVGNEGLRTQRNPAANPTILSGDIGVAGNNADNSYHVVTLSAVDDDTVLDGFTLRGGNANGTIPESLGGGLLCEPGGGMTCNPTLTNLVFSDNAAGSGGGMSLLASAILGSSSPVLRNIAFVGNSAGNGGAMYLSAQGGTVNPSLVNVTFSGNVASANGGAMYLDGSQSGNAKPKLSFITASGNSAGNCGGMLYSYGNHSVPAFHHAILWGDTSPGQPAGNEICNNSGGSSTVVNSVLQSGCPNGGTCIAADPKLGPLRDNGGATPTTVPTAGASAVDAATDCKDADGINVSVDQRGFVRPLGVKCDIGAVEWDRLFADGFGFD